jgi:membrane protease YdiL (CAAX protease family)
LESPVRLTRAPESAPVRWRAIAPVIGWALLPWPLVAVSLFVLHSAAVACLAYGLLDAVGGVWLRRRAGSRITAWRTHLSWGLHAAVGVLMCLLFAATYRIAGAWLLPQDIVLGRLAALGIDPHGSIWVLAYYALANPWLEEWFWRGGVYASLRRAGFTVRPAAVASAALFAAWHGLVVFRILPAPSAAATLIGIFLVGFVLAHVYERTRSLLDVALFHMLGADVPVLLVLFLLAG